MYARRRQEIECRVDALQGPKGEQKPRGGERSVRRPPALPQRQEQDPCERQPHHGAQALHRLGLGEGRPWKL